MCVLIFPEDCANFDAQKWSRAQTGLDQGKVLMSSDPRGVGTGEGILELALRG